MRVRSVVLLAVAVVVIATTATGTQSFSTSELGRGLSADVASDEDAYLGYASDVDDDRTLSVELTNTFSGEHTLDVVVEASNGSASETKSTTLDSGQRELLEFTEVSCDATIDVVATGQSVRIDLTRPVPCDGGDRDGSQN